MTDSRLVARYHQEPRFHAVTERLRQILADVAAFAVAGTPVVLDDRLLAYAEAVDMLYRPPAHPKGASTAGTPWSDEALTAHPLPSLVRLRERARTDPQFSALVKAARTARDVAIEQGHLSDDDLLRHALVLESIVKADLS